MKKDPLPNPSNYSKINHLLQTEIIPQYFPIVMQFNVNLSPLEIAKPPAQESKFRLEMKDRVGNV